MGGILVVAYFECSRSNNHSSTPNTAQQIIATHHGLNGTGIKNKTMSQNKRQPLIGFVPLVPVFSGTSISAYFYTALGVSSSTIQSSPLPRFW